MRSARAWRTAMLRAADGPDLGTGVRQKVSALPARRSAGSTAA